MSPVSYELGTLFLLRSCVNRWAGGGGHTVADEMGADEMGADEMGEVVVCG